jgi:hypothetical protein
MRIKPESMSRRQVLGIAAKAVAVMPIMLLVSRETHAATNAAMRKALQYQDTPKGDAKCVNCVQFVAGKSPADKGQCKAFPGDDEISPNGWCAAFVAKPK